MKVNNENKDIDNNKFLLPPKISNKKTLVLDLDETLVHSQFLEFSVPSDIIIKIGIEKEIYDIHVLIRPGVKEFLEKMKDYYEIVIFTASISKYADILINIIDQKGYCPYRLFREHCTFINNTFVKDLKKLGRDLKDIIIVDNSPFSYSFHPDNGLPILSWFEDKDDKELYNIIPILIFLSNVNDVREYIPKIVINNTISYYEVEKLFKNNEYNNPKNKDNNTNKNSQNIKLINKKYNENDNKNNSNEYNINIQIVQNNINNINNIINEKQTNEAKNTFDKYLNVENNESKNIKKQTEGVEKIMKINPKNIISNIENPNNINNNNKTLPNKKEKVMFHKRQNTFSLNINKVKLNQINKDKNNKKRNNQDITNNQNIKKLIDKSQKENYKKNDKSIHFKQIQNIINKKRKRVKTPTNINELIFPKNNNKIKDISYKKKIKTSISKNKKRNKSNNERTKLLLPTESSDYNLIKKLCTLSYKMSENNNQKRNKYNLIKNKTKFKPNNYRRIFYNKDDNINNSTNITKYSSNNTLSKNMRNEDNYFFPSHRKQSSYNENNFFLKIKKNLIKSQETKTKNPNKSNFVKNENKKTNNLSKVNTNINISYFKNKLIKKTYGNFKKINIKNIDYINKIDKKRLQIDLKSKNTEKNKKMNVNKVNLNGNIFNLYKTLNQNEKKYESNIFNNTIDTFLNDTKSYRKTNHKKTISYNFNSTRNLNNFMLIKSKFQYDGKKNNRYKLKSIKRSSKNEINNIYNEIKNNKKDDSFLFLKNMFKNKIFDYIYYTKDIKDSKDNINNKNELNTINNKIKNINKKSKNKNN